MQQRIDWSNPANGQRLLAAILAAQGMKMDYKSIATMFGRGATYDAIEGHFRKIKRLAASLPDEHCDFTSPPSTTPSTTTVRGAAQRKARAGAGNNTAAFEDTTTTNPRQKTLTGRITKSSTMTTKIHSPPGRMTRKGTIVVVPAGAGGVDSYEGRGDFDLDDEVGVQMQVQSSSSGLPPHVAAAVQQDLVVENNNNFEALMGGWHLGGMNNGVGGGGGDIFMGMCLPGGELRGLSDMES